MFTANKEEEPGFMKQENKDMISFFQGIMSFF